MSNINKIKNKLLLKLNFFLLIGEDQLSDQDSQPDLTPLNLGKVVKRAI